VQSQLVVIVDDRVTNLKILEKLATSLGDGTVAKTFTDPRDALAFTAETCPDLVITDLKMPALDGAEFVRRLRAHARGAEVPVIVITAYEDRDLRYRALDAGATDFLLSPLDHREFRARSRNLLRLRRQHRLSEVKAAALERQMVEAQQRHEEAQRYSHERLLRVIDAVPALIFATDRDGRYVFVNTGFAELFDRMPKQLIGMRPDEIRDDAFTRRLLERDARLLAGEALPATFEEEIEDAQGEQRLLFVTKSALRGDNGDEATVVTVAVDITARHSAERDLIAAKEQAELANRSKTEFLANMSHELRTPLNAIIGFSQVMAGEMLGPIATVKYVGYARDIAVSAEHLLGIINDILDVSKLEAGRLELVEEDLDLGKTVRDLMRLVEEKARAAEVGLKLRIPPQLPRLRADSRKFKQILLNLVGNAIKFSNPGGEVEIVLRNDGGMIAVAVVDHGIGMDEEDKQVAVSRFGQVASPWSRGHPGTGLGLPLAIGLTELHGGNLAIQSSKGVGTTVTVTFPRERSETLATAPFAERRSIGSC
jgi:PAS domain S-box-containing protein